MDSVHVGVVGGTRLPGNVRTFLLNVEQLLARADVDFQLDLVLRESVTDEVPGYEVVDPDLGDPGRAVEMVKMLTSALTRYARDRKPDLLWQVTKFPAHGFATTVAGKRTGVPVLTRFAGDNFREFTLSSLLDDRVKTFLLNNGLGRIPAAYADATVVLGPYGRTEIASRGGNTIYEIPQPVDRDVFQPSNADEQTDLRGDLNLPADKRVLLTVGRLTERKGMKTLIEVAEVLNERDEPFRWYVAGDGPMHEELDAVTGVEVLGRINFERMADYYRAADLLVHPSLVEGLPNVLLEAAACGTPTIARDVGDCSLVSSATFEETEDLLNLLKQTHAPSALGERFESDRLRNDYARALIETAREKP